MCLVRYDTDPCAHVTAVVPNPPIPSKPSMASPVPDPDLDPGNILPSASMSSRALGASYLTIILREPSGPDVLCVLVG